jgi:hypothetical protein
MKIFALLLALICLSSAKTYAAMEYVGAQATDDLETEPVQIKIPRNAPVSEELFSKLWDAYPLGEPGDVKKMIGGKVDEPWVDNTCPIRLSFALNQSGFSVHSNSFMHTLKGADGNHYAFRLSEFITFLRITFGKPTLHASRTQDESPDKLRDAVAGHKGIIVFIVKTWTDATGHVDLWDGQSVKFEEHFFEASDVYLWE